jgi:hypothetical protein
MTLLARMMRQTKYIDFGKRADDNVRSFLCTQFAIDFVALVGAINETSIGRAVHYRTIFTLRLLRFGDDLVRIVDGYL